MSDVSGRLTTQGGLSFIASNDSYELVFFFPNVNDTGHYASSYDRSGYFKLIENGDTITMSYSPIELHVTEFHQFSNHSLISGTFVIQEIYESGIEYIGYVQHGVFTNIPIVHNGPSGNYLIYQGEEADIQESKIMRTNNFFFSRYKFDNEYAYSLKYGMGSSSYSSYKFSSGTFGQINISEINESGNTISGWIKTTEDIDLEIQFQEMADGQMAMVYNFGEEIMYFDSVKYVVPELSPNTYDIYGYKGSSVEIKISASHDPQGMTSTHVQTHLYNYNGGITYLEDFLYGFSFLNFSSNNTKMSFEYGSVEMADFRQVCIKGKNIQLEM